MFRRAESAARQALALDPSLGGAHTVLAEAEPGGAWSRRDEHLMRALDLSPDSPEVLLARASYLACVGREREAGQLVERGCALDPLWTPLAWRRGIQLWLTNSLEAQRFSRERAFRHPEQPFFANLWALNSVFAEDWASFAEAEKAAPSGYGDPHRVQRTLSWGRAVRDRGAAAADRMVRESEERLAASGGLPFEDYLFLWKLGRVEAAFDLAARSTYEYRQDRTRDTPSAFQTDVLFFIGAYRGFTDDPRVVQLFAKLGLCDHWLASDRWPDCADEVPYDFRVEAERAAARGPDPPWVERLAERVELRWFVGKPAPRQSAVTNSAPAL